MTIIDMQKSALRRLGMIATSPSWRRFWMPYRWMKYPWVNRFVNRKVNG